MAPETLIAWIWSELAAQAARLPRFQINEGVLQSKMRWLLVFVVVFHEERTPLWHNVVVGNLASGHLSVLPTGAAYA